VSQASELLSAETSHSAWLDLRTPAPNSAPQTVPPWIEALEVTVSQRNGSPDMSGMMERPGPTGERGASRREVASISPNATASLSSMSAESPSAGLWGSFATFRIRLHRPENTPGDVQLRLLFEDDASGARPTVSAWDELGNARWRNPKPLGEGLGVATSESLTVPMTGVDYLEITMPGDGRQLRGAFLSWLETRTIEQAIDAPFARTQTLREAFEITPPLPPRAGDEHRFGVVTAVLQRDPVRLGGKLPLQSGGGNLARSVEIAFELERPPLVALLNFEVLNATGGAPPRISINDRDLGPAEFTLPDLADPGFRGQAREGAADLAWQYTGWVRAQKLVPASMLTAGMNKLLLSLSENSDPAAVRSVEVQLKYYWEKFDYTLAPRQP
jgi:hypothetical protein